MIDIDSHELFSALSLALDVAENRPFEHAQRTAYIALTIAKELYLSEVQINDIYAGSLLHDIGVIDSKADHHKDCEMVVSHCIHGNRIVKLLPISKNVAESIRWHHANWDGSGPFERDSSNIPIESQVIYLADQLDIRLKELESIYGNRTSILDYTKQNKGILFNPDVVDAFLAAQEREKFWLDYRSPSISNILSTLEVNNKTKIPCSKMEDVASVFAKIIDNKSPYTHRHSLGITDLTLALGQHHGFDSETLLELKISALLHDLGKLAISNEILDKPGKLTSFEFQIIKSHAYYTKKILSKIRGFERISNWAANHHETLDGKGYPEGIESKNLSLQERMIAVCDVYTALTEDRPYRAPMPQSRAFEVLHRLVSDNKLCPEILQSLKEVLDISGSSFVSI